EQSAFNGHLVPTRGGKWLRRQRVVPCRKRGRRVVRRILTTTDRRKLRRVRAERVVIRWQLGHDLGLPERLTQRLAGLRPPVHHFVLQARRRDRDQLLDSQVDQFASGGPEEPPALEDPPVDKPFEDGDSSALVGKRRYSPSAHVAMSVNVDSGTRFS